jgi:O-methyltransferase involved in polyketide biosynthesis
MSRRFRWVLIVTIVAMLLAVAIGRALIARRSAAVVADKAASAPAQAVDLMPGDVARATRTDLCSHCR